MQTRIGVFLCDCGGTLSKNIDFSNIRTTISRLSDVVYVDTASNLCSEEGQAKILSTITDTDINRVVVAACSPQLYQCKIGKILESKLDHGCLFWANIREQCCWVHPDTREATNKARGLIAEAVSKAKFAEIAKFEEVPVNRNVLIIGGGIVGMQAAIELSNLGLPVTIVERETTLGGDLIQSSVLYPSRNSADALLSAKTKDIKETGDITVFTSAKVLDIKGEAGNFTAKIKADGKNIGGNFGAIVIATGCDLQPIENKLGFKLSNNILTQSQLEQKIKTAGEVQSKFSSVGIILDIVDEHSRLAAIKALSNAMTLKEKWRSEVFIFCKNMKVDSSGIEGLYRDLRDKGVVFFKFGDNPPRVSHTDGKINITINDPLLTNEEVSVVCDHLIVEDKVVPAQSSEDLKTMLNLGTGPGGFYQENNVELFPIYSNKKGVFFVGNCHADIDLSRALVEASNAALNTYQLLGSGEVLVEIDKVMVDPNKCRFCLTCVRACPHDAIRIAQIESNKQVAKIMPVACMECGVCVAVCPAKAIKYRAYTDEQILAGLEV